MPSTCTPNNLCSPGTNCSVRTRRTRRNQRGGDNSGALIQLAPVSAATQGLYSPNGGNVQKALQDDVHTALTQTFGPNKIQQFGGKRKGYKARRRTKKQTRTRHHR